MAIPQTWQTDEERVLTEAWCRREARKQGFKAMKSRSRRPDAPDYQSWWVIEPNCGGLVAGHDYFGMSLDELVDWLKTPWPKADEEEEL